jgi:ketosteroid isomerase-like protein
MVLDAEFAQAVRDVEAAARDFACGDAAPFKELWSHADDVTIFGGYGAHERGWDQVGPRLDWAAARFPDTTGGTYEALASDCNGSLGYAIGIERWHATVAHRADPVEIVLRVTHLFRRDDGLWKLIHRHADAITSVLAPEALVQHPAAAPSVDGPPR